MAKVKYTDNAVSLLTATVNNVDDPATLSITPGDGAKFPSIAAGEWFPLIVVKTTKEFEKMRCTARSGDSFTVDREQGGTTKLSFAIGDAVYLGPTKELLDEILFREDAQEGKPWYCGVAGGTANALTLTATPVPTAYVDGAEFTFTALLTNTNTAVTVNINGLGAVNLRDATGAALAVGAIVSGANYRIQRNGTNNQFRIVSGIIPTAVPGDFTVNGQLFALGGIDIIPKNTKMLFVNNAAPAGWTFDNTYADRVIRCAATAGAGTGTGGTWTISGLSGLYSGGASCPFSLYAQVLQTSSIAGPASVPFAGPQNATVYGSITVPSFAVSVSHTPGWRPAYVDTIVCTMNRGP